eukprot:GILI01006364.1.p1 GENE.GILI01006364.1~~GILI01006364.1.p1  ORF type:complete len:705 (-),score=168.63 GILI01006364.1:206-2131(-)
MSGSEADKQYDTSIDAILDTIRNEIKKIRPADPTQYIVEHLGKSKINVPLPDSCKLIVSRTPDALTLKPLTVVVFGASGDLAKKKTFPALFGLYCNGLLPLKNAENGKVSLSILGFARTEYSQEEFHSHIRPLLEKANPAYKCHVDKFLSHVRYVSGESYHDATGFRKLRAALEHHEGWNKLPVDTAAFKGIVDSTKDEASEQKGNRLFYLALPPTAFIETCTAVRENLVNCYGPEAADKQAATAKAGSDGPNDFWTRVVVEKPFGHDTKSSTVLADALNRLFSESQIFRIDHYLGKEMVQNVVALRFANHVFSSVWNGNHIHSVQIVFKEQIGTEGRGGYFDKFGIIRDVIQNHLCQILALIAMEKPKTLSAEDVRDEKVSLLRCIQPVAVGDCVIGQYTAPADGSMKGYKEDEGVPADSKTPTFAIMKLHINNDRWNGVPFILKAGKAMEDKCVTVRIQFKEELRPFSIAIPLPSDELSLDEATDPCKQPARIMGPNRNELVIRAQPNEAMYLKINTKNPGLAGDDRAADQETSRSDLTVTELDLNYGKRFNVRIPEAYESLVNEAILGNGTNFVRRDELEASWRIFTPLLHAIDKGEVPVREYRAGTRGPSEAEDLIQSTGYRRSRDYFYKQMSASKI